MFRVYADDPHHAFAMDHLALVANLLDGRSNLHKVKTFRRGDAENAEISAEKKKPSNFLSFLCVPPYLRVSASKFFTA
jgi:hypothetical protein